MKEQIKIRLRTTIIVLLAAILTILLSFAGGFYVAYHYYELTLARYIDDYCAPVYLEKQCIENFDEKTGTTWSHCSVEQKGRPPKLTDSL